MKRMCISKKKENPNQFNCFLAFCAVSSFILGISIFIPLHLVFALMFRILKFKFKTNMSLCKNLLQFETHIKELCRKVNQKFTRSEDCDCF